MYKPRRDQLASFLKTPELIRAFEQLFNVTSTDDGSTLSSVINSLLELQGNQDALSEDIEEASIESSSAGAKANGNAADLKRLADALELLSLAPIREDTASRLVNALEMLALAPLHQLAIDSGPISTHQQPDNAATFDYIDVNLNAPVSAKVGRLEWGLSDDTLNIHHTNGVTQQVGQETYLRVFNNTGATLTNGKAVGFNPVTDQFINYIADGSLNPLYIAGVATEDIANNTFGRVTVYGRVRDLDTTGTPYGETWAAGDLLYVSTTVAGGLTNSKPTAPNLSIPIGLVFTVHATTGEIGVRPTAEQQLFYGSFFKNADQSPAAANTAYAITWNGTAISNGISIGATTSHIVVAHAGLYSFTASFQMSSTSASAKTVWLWFRKNGVDVPDSTMITSLEGTSTIHSAARGLLFSLQTNDYIELMFACDSTNMTMDNSPSTAFAPSSPAAILTVSQEQQ